MHIHHPNHTIHRFKYLLSSASNDYDNFKHIRSNRKTLLKKSKLKKFHPMNWMNWLVMCIHKKNLFRITPNQIECFFSFEKKNFFQILTKAYVKSHQQQTNKGHIFDLFIFYNARSLFICFLFKIKLFFQMFNITACLCFFKSRFSIIPRLICDQLFFSLALKYLIIFTFVWCSSHLTIAYYCQDAFIIDCHFIRFI